MPASYHIDPERRTIFSSATGVVTDDDLKGHQSRLRSDPAFDRTFNQLWDLRGVAEARVTNGAIRTLADSRSFDAGARRGVVAPQDLVYGLARMFEMLRDDSEEEIRAFRNFEEAKQWLGLA